jgi:hypothetical protein
VFQKFIFLKLVCGFSIIKQFYQGRFVRYRDNVESADDWKEGFVSITSGIFKQI